jgi:hypothetical protein
MGSGLVTAQGSGWDLRLPAGADSGYHNAQLCDYQWAQDFHWRPPVRMTVQAGFSGHQSLIGTAGFGFWNHPFVPGERGFRLPKAVWFFFSAPPSKMQLAQGVPGPGWKAATFDATRPAFLLLAPAAPLGLLLMRIPALYRRLWPIGQRAIGVSEHRLPTELLATPHTYTLEWLPEQVRFAVDGQWVHDTRLVPRGPLGFIAWMDNQYAVVTPQGQFGWGVVPVKQAQGLHITELSLTPLAQTAGRSK